MLAVGRPHDLALCGTGRVHQPFELECRDDVGIAAVAVLAVVRLARLGGQAFVVAAVEHEEVVPARHDHSAEALLDDAVGVVEADGLGRAELFADAARHHLFAVWPDWLELASFLWREPCSVAWRCCASR